MSGAFHIFKSSAGSGKTYQLSKSYIKIILACPANGGERNPEYYRNVLALTFTKAAAEEMKARILAFLRDLGQLRKTDSSSLNSGTQELLAQIKDDLRTEYPNLSLSTEEIGLRAYLCWKKIIHNYSEFSVQTIDSFVNSVSRSFYRDLGLAFNLQLTFDKNELVEEAADTFFNNLESESPWAKWIHEYFLYQRQKDQTWRLRWLVIEFAQKILPYWNQIQESSDEIQILEQFAILKKELQKKSICP